MALAKDGDRKMISVVVTKDLHSRLQADAERKALNVSALTRMILKRYLDEEEKKL